MKNIYSLTTSIAALAVLVGSVIAAYGTMQLLDIKRLEAMNEARYQCAVSLRYESRQSEEVTVWYPVEDLYNKCLEEKGVQ